MATRYGVRNNIPTLASISYDEKSFSHYFHPFSLVYAWAAFFFFFLRARIFFSSFLLLRRRSRCTRNLFRNIILCQGDILVTLLWSTSICSRWREEWNSFTVCCRCYLFHVFLASLGKKTYAPNILRNSMRNSVKVMLRTWNFCLIKIYVYGCKCNVKECLWLKLRTKWEVCILWIEPFHT